MLDGHGDADADLDGNLSPCTAQSAQVVVTVHKVAVVTAGANQTICSSGSTSGLNGSVSGGTTTGCGRARAAALRAGHDDA